MPPRACIPPKTAKHIKKSKTGPDQTGFWTRTGLDWILITGFFRGPDRSGPDRNIPSIYSVYMPRLDTAYENILFQSFKIDPRGIDILHIPSYTFTYLRILANTPIYLDIPPYTFKYPIVGIWEPTWDTKMIITQAPERLRRWEFNTKLPNMSPEGLVHPKGPKQIIKIANLKKSLFAVT